MDSLLEHCRWLSSELRKPPERLELCQCGTEDVITRSDDAQRMRAVLLSYVFLDQFIFTHYPQVHREFKQTFPGPKLRQHAFGGHASPSWFVYSQHGFDVEVDWSVITHVFKVFLSDGLQWLVDNVEVNSDQFWQQVKIEINWEFESGHWPKLNAVLPAEMAAS